MQKILILYLKKFLKKVLNFLFARDSQVKNSNKRKLSVIFKKRILPAENDLLWNISHFPN